MLDNQLYTQLDIPEILQPFIKLKVDKLRSDGFFKPLLVLIVLMRLKYEGVATIEFREVNKVLSKVLSELIKYKDYNQINTHDPFWRLKKDGIWEIDTPEEKFTKFQEKFNRRRAYKTLLLETNPTGKFTDDIIKYLEHSPQYIDLIAERMLEKYFYSSTYDHRDKVKHLIGYYETDINNQLLFNRNVLRAYNSKCSVCQSNKRFFNTLIDIRVTPIVPVDQHNFIKASSGIVLCKIHNEFYKKGIFTIEFRNRKYTIATTEKRPTNHIDYIVNRYKDKYDSLLNEEHKLVIPEMEIDRPTPEMLNWHNENVFLGQNY